MTVLLDIEIPRTLDVLVERLSDPRLKGAAVEAWVFEDADRRAEAEAALARAGVRARIESAYKPLLHHALDRAELADATAVHLRYPSPGQAAPGRFLLEAHPLAALAPRAAFAAEPWDDGQYALTVTTASGSVVHHVEAPNTLRPDGRGGHVLCPTAWLRIRGAGALDRDEPLASDFALAYDAVMAAVGAYPWPAQPPFFDVLRVEVAIGGVERPVPALAERMSTREALHEDVYFSLLEFFQARAGLPQGERTLRPGQIVPEVRGTEGPTCVRVILRPHVADPVDADAPEPDWAACETPPLLVAVHAGLAAIPGAPLAAVSRQGRAVPGVIVEGAGPPVLVTAGQHANETSGWWAPCARPRRCARQGPPSR